MVMKRAEMIKVLHALKNGVVPDTNLELLMAGREREIKEFERLFMLTEAGTGIVKFISGDYGTGKSFLLHLLKHKALEQNFVVTKIQIDKGFRYSFVDFYYHLMHSLSTKSTGNKQTSFEDVFEQWIKELKVINHQETVLRKISEVISTLNQYNNAFSRAFLSYVKAKIKDDDALADSASSWIKGEKNIPAKLKLQFGVIGSIDKQNAVDFFKAFNSLTTLMGYKGLIILIDEMDLIMSERSNIRQGTYEYLRYLIDATGAGEIGHCMFVMTGTERLFEDKEKGFQMYPALYQRVVGNKDNSSFQDMRQPVLKLRGISPENLLPLTERLMNMHFDAYQWNPGISHESLHNWTLLFKRNKDKKPNHLNIRDFIRKQIEILDMMEQNPDHQIFKNELKFIEKEGLELVVNRMRK